VQDEQSIFHDKTLEEMWSLLRQVVVFYMRPFEGPEGPEEKVAFQLACEKHHGMLNEYAKLAEKWFGHLLCKSNLHNMMCPLPVQQATRGHSFYYTEFWVERMVQWAKKMTKFRTTGCPEKLIVGNILLRLALDQMTAVSPGNLTMGGWIDKHKGTPRRDTFHGDNLDPGMADNSGMLGPGVLPKGDLAQECVEAVHERFKKHSNESWGAGYDIQAEGMTVYQRAQLASAEIVQSVSYDRTKTRVSYYIHQCETVRKKINGKMVDVDRYHVGKVLYFLLAKPMSNGVVVEGNDLRFAVSDLYTADLQETCLGDILLAEGMCGPAPVAHHKCFPVLLSEVRGKVVSCHKGSVRARPASTRLAFVPYTHSRLELD
jgi:hypothetical protein